MMAEVMTEAPRGVGGFVPSSCSTIARVMGQAPHGSVARDDETSAVRVKIVVTKKQLRQMVAAMGQGRCGAAAAVGHHRLAKPPSVEQLLLSLRRRHMKRAEKGQCRSRWRPELTSIPEEV